MKSRVKWHVLIQVGWLGIMIDRRTPWGSFGKKSSPCRVILYSGGNNYGHCGALPGLLVEKIPEKTGNVSHYLSQSTVSPTGWYEEPRYGLRRNVYELYLWFYWFWELELTCLWTIDEESLEYSWIIVNSKWSSLNLVGNEPIIYSWCPQLDHTHCRTHGDRPWVQKRIRIQNQIKSQAREQEGRRQRTAVEGLAK